MKGVDFMKKYFVEAIVWTMLITTLLTSVIMTFEMRNCKSQVIELYNEGWTMPLCNRSVRIGNLRITYGYSYVKPEIRGWQGHLDERIPDEGYYLIVEDAE